MKLAIIMTPTNTTMVEPINSSREGQVTCLSSSRTSFRNEINAMTVFMLPSCLDCSNLQCPPLSFRPGGIRRLPFACGSLQVGHPLLPMKVCTPIRRADIRRADINSAFGGKSQLPSNPSFAKTGQEGFEPPTRGFGDRCSANWSYWPSFLIVFVCSRPLILCVKQLSQNLRTSRFETSLRFPVRGVLVAPTTVLIQLKAFCYVLFVLCCMIISTLASCARQRHEILCHFLLYFFNRCRNFPLHRCFAQKYS